jgi:hypothetical protein
MNTKISYRYRDAANYKESNTVILSGELAESEKKEILKRLDGGEYFIPSQVGLEDIQPQMEGFPSQDDHVFHELESVENTDDPPDTDMSAKTLLESFRGVERWDISAAMEKLGLV